MCGNAENFGTHDPKLPERTNFNYKTFETTAEALKLRLYWVGGRQWGCPGTGFDVDTLEVNGWATIWAGILKGLVRFEAWSPGMHNLCFLGLPTKISLQLR